MSSVRFSFVLSIVAVIAASGLSQNCPKGSVVLSVSPANPAPGTPITISVTGTAGSWVTMYRSPNLGQTTLSGGPLGGTVICLAAPMFSWSLGPIPASGTKTVQYQTFASAAGQTVNYQAVTHQGGSAPVNDTSNVASITFTTPTPPTCNPGAVQLAVSPSNPPAGTPVSVTVTGAPGAHVTLFRGAAAGATQLNGPGPLSGTVICLNSPFNAIPFGTLDANGTKTANVPTPPNVAVGATWTFQAVTSVGAQQSATIDTSNTVTVTFAAAPPPPPCTPGALVLAITPDVPVTAGATITTAVTGPAGAHIFLAESHQLGSTSLPGSTLSLCLGMPHFLHPLGVIPAGGTLSLSHVVPVSANLPGNVTVYYQAVSVSGGPGQAHTYDTSNTDSLMF